MGHEPGSISHARYPEFREEYLVEATVSLPPGHQRQGARATCSSPAAATAAGDRNQPCWLPISWPASAKAKAGQKGDCRARPHGERGWCRAVLPIVGTGELPNPPRDAPPGGEGEPRTDAVFCGR
ncbi:MAG: hypothetical protein WKG07_06695 [Hymenobacter sp.]